MHRLAGHDPQTFAFAQGLPAEQTARAGWSAIRYFHAAKGALCSEIANLTTGTRIFSPLPRIARQAKLAEPERDMHSEWQMPIWSAAQ
jgi:hypothetical protein